MLISDLTSWLECNVKAFNSTKLSIISGDIIQGTFSGIDLALVPIKSFPEFDVVCYRVISMTRFIDRYKIVVTSQNFRDETQLRHGVGELTLTLKETYTLRFKQVKESSFEEEVMNQLNNKLKTISVDPENEVTNNFTYKDEQIGSLRIKPSRKDPKSSTIMIQVHSEVQFALLTIKGINNAYQNSSEIRKGKRTVQFRKIPRGEYIIAIVLL